MNHKAQCCANKSWTVHSPEQIISFYHNTFIDKQNEEHFHKQKHLSLVLVQAAGQLTWVLAWPLDNTFLRRVTFLQRHLQKYKKTWNLAHPCELLRHFRLPEWVSLERTTLGLLVLLPQCHPRAQCKQPRDFRILAQKGIPVVSGENIGEC